jgi:thymidylate synthase
MLKFEPLYFRDRLKIINPYGTIGVVTLWSKVDYVIERFRQANPDLIDPEKNSPIAVFGTLYGNGLREMLRNLLWNPQIQVLLICGKDRLLEDPEKLGSFSELRRFFLPGYLEPVDSPLIRYKTPPGIEKVSICKIGGTNRLIDDLVKPQQFKYYSKGIPEVVLMHPSDPQDENFLGSVKHIFEEDPRPPEPVCESDRKKVPLPEVEVQYFPSNPRGHMVAQDSILEAWKEVLHLLSRFGRRVTLKKGDRLELQHVKVVVEKPRFEADDKLRAVNLIPGRLRLYQEDILKGEMRPDETYNYGHRLRAYFGLDTLAACAERLKKDPEDRKSYVALWDSARDLTVKEGRPCLVSLFFRKFEGKITLSGTFRTHNAMDAWPMNVYGLMAIRDWVAKKARLLPGAITVISHSLGLDPRELDRALLIIGKRPFKVRLDPMGYFRVTLDGKEILVEHRFEDVTLKEYRAKTAASLQHQIARDVAVSDINHAIYLGRQLAKAEMALKDGREFVQD